MESSSVFQRPVRGRIQILREVPGRLHPHDDDLRRFPDGRPDFTDRHDKILHATFAVGDQILTGGDEPPESYRRPAGFALLLNVASPEEADRVFAALAEGGEARMPLTETFWTPRFGMLVDQFGTPWMINCGNPD